MISIGYVGMYWNGRCISDHVGVRHLQMQCCGGGGVACRIPLFLPITSSVSLHLVTSCY